jgi:tRNA (guanine-N7-)-methyltransferase
MRMRKKRNLDTFVTMYPDILSILEKPDPNIKKSLEIKRYLDLESLLNKSEVELEIGCGKGAFICELASRNPDKAYIAVEVNKNVIVEACKRAREMNLRNVHFINTAAEILPCFLKEGSVTRIYLNFSCPFPKHTYANRRLTSPAFLKSYRMYLKDGGEIHQKTDNMHFFEYSVEQFTSSGYKIKNVSLDLHNSDFEGNIMTEYEKRFTDLGMPIYRLEAY